MYKKKICPECGSVFEPNTGTQKICSKCASIKKENNTIKVCPTCGRKFKAAGRRKYCCRQCQKNQSSAKYIAKMLYGDEEFKDRDIIMDETMIASVDELRSEPTHIEMIETKILLQDFGIEVDVPSFKTNNELYSWRKSIISKHLEN